MPYQAKCETGTVLWQLRCLEKGVKIEELRVHANMLWRRDFSEYMERRDMSVARANWIKNWEYETLEEVSDRNQRYVSLLKSKND
jgi:hypothetical protein